LNPFANCKEGVVLNRLQEAPVHAGALHSTPYVTNCDAGGNKQRSQQREDE